jgi:hypothetical protein
LDTTLSRCWTIWSMQLSLMAARERISTKRFSSMTLTQALGALIEIS